MLQIKRIYEEADSKDGVRILVDRLWPRGISKERAHVDRWVKELAPSDELRRWFGHDPELWQEFRSRYGKELEGQGELLQEIAAAAAKGPVTLLYAAKDEEHNNAVALKELIGKRARK
jgi:uncharacterized protein YeaO (DUF488 family)